MLEQERYNNVYESRTYRIVAIISQSIYCFGGGCAVAPFGVSLFFLSVSIQVLCPFNPLFILFQTR